MQWHYEIAAVDAITLYFGRDIEVAQVPRIQAVQEALSAALSDRLVDMVPAYTSLLVRYDLKHDDLAHLLADITPILAALPENPEFDHAAPVIDLPVYYAPEVGPELPLLAERSGLTIDQVIECHSALIYQVFAIGFAPGFAYLGEVAEAIRAPRLATPRKRVPVGALGIADSQTAIYPLVSPGGWNLIGRTPEAMFQPDQMPPSRLQAGQKVRFCPISRERYLEMGGHLDDLPWQQEAR